MTINVEVAAVFAAAVLIATSGLPAVVNIAAALMLVAFAFRDKRGR